MNRGYWIEVINADNQIHKETGINSYSEALYRVKRRYSLTPNLKRVNVFVGTKLLNSFDAVEGKIKMGKLSQIQNSGASSYDINYPRATDDDKQSLDTFEIPFVVVGADRVSNANKQGDEYVYFHYQIEIDPTSDEYSYAERKKQFNHLKMTITLPVDNKRQVTHNVIVSDYLNKGLLCKLVGFAARGKTYYSITDFTE